MALILNQDEMFRPGVMNDRGLKRNVYSGIDALVMPGLLKRLLPRLDATTERIYALERALQGPAMSMMIRGCAIDDTARKEGLAVLRKDERVLERQLTLDVAGVWSLKRAQAGKCSGERAGKNHRWAPRGTDPEEQVCLDCGIPRVRPVPFNPRSHQHNVHLLYTDMGLAKQRDYGGAVTTDKEALDRLQRKYPEHVVLLQQIRDAKGLRKIISVLAADGSPDGRWHCSFNVGATVGARWSSSEDCYKDNSNMMNLPGKIRNMFVADPGMELLSVDLEQAESRVIAYKFEDEAYIRAHEEGNVHVYVGRILFPDLPWTGDEAEDKVMLKGTVFPADPVNTYYDKSKRNQHGMNYMLEARGLAKHAKMPFPLAKLAFARYHGEFNAIRSGQKAVIAEGQRTAVLTSSFGRRRQFFGRLWDRHTHRQMVAMDPQDTVAEITNIALMRIWRELEPDRVQLLQQGYDSILCQTRIGDREAQWRVVEHYTIPVDIKGRTMLIPLDAQIGQNWRDMEPLPERNGRWNEIAPRAAAKE